MAARPAHSIAIARVGHVLLLAAFTLAGCPCCHHNPVTPPPFPPLEVAEQHIIAAIGDTLETHPENEPEQVYSVVFPPGSLSADAMVTVQSPENDPANPCAARLTQASSFLTIDTGSAALVDTIFVLAPYTDYDEANPPMPFLLDAEGRPLDVLVPSPSSGFVSAAVPPQPGRLGWAFGLYDYMDPHTQDYLDIVQGSSFDLESSSPVVLLIHGCGGDPADFKRGPAPTLYQMLYDGYGGRVWTWDYASVLQSIEATGDALKRAVEAFEAAHGAFPFKIDIVAHSEGGLEARYFVRNGGARFVRKVVFLGTPNDGTTALAYLWHWNPFSPGRDGGDDDLINVDAPGFIDCLHGSAFLSVLNTTASLGCDIEYFTIAGDYTPENPHAPGRDDHFISVDSVDLDKVSHESVTLHEQQEIRLKHGQLKENWNDGGGNPSPTPGDLLVMIAEDLDIPLTGYGTVIVDPDPDSLSAPWHLEGPGDYSHDGAGDVNLPGCRAGSYTLTWEFVSGYEAPTPNPQTKQLYALNTTTFAGTYVENGGPEPPEMILVSNGVFTMGDPGAYCATEHRVTLTHDFYLGQHEVTNQEYLDAVQWAYDHNCVTATATSVRDNLDGSTVELLDLDGAASEIAFQEGSGVFSHRDAGHGGNNGDHPVKEVTWYGAARYCDWLSLMNAPPLGRAYEHTGDWSCNSGNPYGAPGYRLPTDAEWEYAAQYDDERIYPWGNDAPTCARANYFPYPQPHCVGWTSPVRSYPDAPGPLRLSDMAGNVWEWCNDWWVCDLAEEPISNPEGPASGTYRVLHGGSWGGYDVNSLRCAFRYCHYDGPGGSAGTIGFRVAMTANP